MTKMTPPCSGERYGSYSIYRVGTDGLPMASNLLKQGHHSASSMLIRRVQRLVDKGAQPASSPAQATIGAEFVITMLPNGDLVRSVLFGEQGVCENSFREALVIDMSTIHPLQTDKLIADMPEQRVQHDGCAGSGHPTTRLPAHCCCWQAVRRSK
ncbi:oxidoreductase [Salmonella enterica subsp. enterica]|uniref:Oxidoreductase n=1 Tax=Salmonella enterica I TaxID=59201 RepID=A0A379UY44_SALET|nr:oxidoreductase [Salmonella enterica subsp. enterica]